MQTITCDVCRKKVDDPVTGLSFFHIADHEICEACKDSLDVQIKQTIRNKEPFVYQWYAQFVDDSIVKAIQKGRF